MKTSQTLHDERGSIKSRLSEHAKKVLQRKPEEQKAFTDKFRVSSCDTLEQNLQFNELNIYMTDKAEMILPGSLMAYLSEPSDIWSFLNLAELKELSNV